MSAESSRSPAQAPPAKAPLPSPASRLRWPDLGGADVGLLLTSRWRITSVDDPIIAAERAALAWSQSSTPAGLLASHVFISADDRKLVRISQWRDDEAEGSVAPPPSTAATGGGTTPGSASRVKTGRKPAIVPVAEAAVEHLGTRVYRPHRSWIQRAPDAQPGSLFVIDLDLGGPGRAQDWVELIFQAVEAGGAVPEGLLAAHFYVSDDGRRAVNFAEWVSDEAHHAAISDGGFMTSPAWARARAFAAGKVTVESYRFFRSTAQVV